MIWYDKDFNSNKYKSDNYVSPLADDSEMPCDACPMRGDCEVA